MSDHARQGANGSPSRAASGAGRSSGAPSAGGPPGRDRPPRSRLIPIVGLGLAAGALLAGLVSLAVGEGGPTGIDVEGGNEAQRLFGGLPQEGAALGDPDAPVTLSIFNDLQCIECAEYQLAVVPPLVEDLVRPGEAKLELRHFPVGPKQTEVAGFAATAAGEQGSQWQYAHIFFANVDRVGRAGVTDEVLDAVAAAVPADQFEIERWRLDRDSPEVAARVAADSALATELRLPAEPAVVVDGPGGTEQLEDSPSVEEIEAAAARVAGG